MEDLSLRFAYEQGLRNPTSDDIRKALLEIESGVRARPEFSIENFSNWRKETIDGQTVIKRSQQGRWASAATFYNENDPIPLGWIVTLCDDDASCFVLAMTDRSDREVAEGICCGGPLRVVRVCIVPFATALDALVYFLQHRDKSPRHAWLARSESFRFV